MTRVAILDDYQGVARRMADWTSLPAGTELVIFADHLNDAGAVAARLADFDAVVAMRERTAFPRALLEKLPRLRLLVTTGMRNASIDVGAAVERGVIVCGTAGLPYPTAERSEEHTSELQSLAYLVCRLLLEKKKMEEVT